MTENRKDFREEVLQVSSLWTSIGKEPIEKVFASWTKGLMVNVFTGNEVLSDVRYMMVPVFGFGH